MAWVTPFDPAATGPATSVEGAPRRMRPGRPGRRRLLAIAAVIAAAFAAFGVGFIIERGGQGRAAPDPGLVHVHGMGVNPADDRLYVATHTGLYRVDGPQEATRIADRYQDTMGFTVVGSDRFIASGHPDMRDRDLQETGKPPLLGLVQSGDGGRTWSSISLLGEADLHTIVAVDGSIVAYDSTGQRLLVSSDGGLNWQTRSSTVLASVAVDPADADRMVAVAPDGTSLSSADGGRTWSSTQTGPGPTVLRWGSGGLWGGSSDGGFSRFDSSTGRWTSTYRFDGAVEALSIEGATIYVAVDGSGIWRSSDGGSGWTLVYQPTIG